VVSRTQLLALGLGDATITDRVNAGKLHRLARGAYAVGNPAPPRLGRLLACTLSLGPGAVLSHTSAAEVWGLLGPRSGAVHVTVAHRARNRRGIRVHEARGLPQTDHGFRDGIPVTTVPRTLLDLAETATPHVLKRAVSQAYVVHGTPESSLREQIARSPGRHGVPRLAKLLDDGAAPTRSVLEDRLLELVRRHGLPEPRVNHKLTLAGQRVEVDLLFVAQRLVVEADGGRFHGHTVARGTDSEKQALLEASGYRVVRVNWAQVTERAQQTVRRLRIALQELPAGA
jgi:very-short-patch-repair endonuclease